MQPIIDQDRLGSEKGDVVLVDSERTDLPDSYEDIDGVSHTMAVLKEDPAQCGWVKTEDLEDRGEGEGARPNLQLPLGR